ncbi:hypothetical protein BDN72DRAFT_285535 [Pluteus cervinus]|uniref:Uncharacterized protein n=1 Tax=Pluteus cervinus TaxID=181527 RepID=A0ACD3AED1_9AGAR|nr:hypothetical protein BDN72DRAFT_285535 [Pluteus cervinus]
MPHRLPSIFRYKLSDDVLMAILGHFDPATLWCACKAFERVRTLTMGYQHLRYIYELAVTGMKDGPGFAHRNNRLELLLAYKRDWPTLNWTHETAMQVPSPCRVGVSGGFLHEIWDTGPQQSTLQLTELPSFRTGHPPATPRQVRFNTSKIECAVVDNAQALIITGQVISAQNGQIGMRLSIRDLWTFGKHPRATSPIYDFTTQSSLRISNVSMIICGGKLLVSIEFAGGRIRHHLLDWRSLASKWLDDQDVCFINSRHLLAIGKTNDNTPILNLYNIHQVTNLSIEREYELPEHWRNSVVSFSQNLSPAADLPDSQSALFYPDPTVRVFLLTARERTTSPPVGGLPPPTRQQWLFINESYFRAASRRDRIRVPWGVWGKLCLMRNIPATMVPMRGPQVVGTKVVYLELDERHLHNRPAGQTRNCPSRLSIIDFAPFPETAGKQSGGWAVGSESMLIPNETSRDLPANTVNGLTVEAIRVTEDNIALFLEVQPNYRPVMVLSFGLTNRPRGIHNSSL